MPTHPLKTRWRMMVRRCYDSHATGFEHYGGRGITVCARWRESFEAFVADVGPRPSLTHTLDRKDRNGPYAPDNCRWATQAEQHANLPTVRTLTWRGETLTINEWSQRVGISPLTIKGRLRRGFSLDLALTAKPEFGKRVRVPRIAELLEQHRISRSALYARLHKGWSLDAALTTDKHQGQRGIAPSTRTSGR